MFLGENMSEVHALRQVTTVKVNRVNPLRKDSMEVKKNFRLAHELRPILRTMGVFGIYHTPKRWLGDDKSTWRYRLHLLHKCYCLVMQLLLWFNVVRMLYDILKTPHLDPVQLSYEAFFVECALNSTIWYYICSTDRLPDCIQFWQEYCQSSKDSKNLGISLDVSWLRRRLRVALCICIFTIAFNLINTTLTLYGPQQFPVSFTNSSYDPLRDPGNFLVISTVFDSAAFAFPMAIFVIFCLIFVRQFRKLTDDFISPIIKKGDLQKDIILYRRQHQYMSKAVFLVDQIFSFYLAVLASIHLVFVFFTLYHVLILQSIPNAYLVTLMTCWMVFMCVTFGLVTVSASQVLEKVLYYNLVNNVSRF